MTAPAQWILVSDGIDHPLTGPGMLLLGNAPRINVIAHSLAQINRFTGHAARPYSVAEHSLLVCDIVQRAGLGPAAQLLALLHDAHEAFVGDVASPVKWTLGAAWRELETPHALQVRHAFGMHAAHADHGKCIKAADLKALATERRDLMRFDPAVNLHWPILDTPGREVRPVDSEDLNSCVRTLKTWRQWRDAFLERFVQLNATRAAQGGVPLIPTETTA